MNEEHEDATQHDHETMTWSWVAWRLVGVAGLIVIVAFICGWRPWE